MTIVCGVILAGGRSSRFGREKATALLAGRPLIAWTLETLQRRASPVAVSAPASSGAASFAASLGLTCLADADGVPAGPLAGVASGLKWVAGLGAQWLATAPCDTPFLPDNLVARLLGEKTDGGAVARTADGLQPLCALWTIQALDVLGTVEGHPPVQHILDRLGAATVSFDDPAAFANLNTPQEFNLAQARPNRPAARTVR